MKTKIFYCTIFIILFISVYASGQIRNSVFQYSVISALLEGDYDGDLSFNELKKHGDFGLGTLNHLDGELLLVDGKFYQVASDGKVNPVDSKKLTPFAIVTYFKADETQSLNDSLSLKDLIKFIDAKLPGENYIYAVRIDGNFSYVKTRSVPAQKKPYSKLVEVTKNQAIFEFNNTEGTLVGFRFPAYTEGVNVPGYHFHFISKDKKSGGHVLDLKVKDIRIEIAKQNNISISFPQNDDFKKIDLTKRNAGDLNKAEK